jgi:hypothetical protein
MKIKVTEIMGIEAREVVRDSGRLVIDVHMDESELHDLFISLWEAVGDEGLEAWLSYEGLKLCSKEK